MEDLKTQSNIDIINDFIKKYGKLKKKKFKVKLFGLGTFGCDIVEKLSTTDIKNIDMYGLNCDESLLQNCFKKLQHKILIGKKITKGHGCGGNDEVAKRALLCSEKRIKRLMNNTHVLFIITSHASAIGRNSLFTFADWANELGVTLFVINLAPEKQNKQFMRRKLGVRRYSIEGQTLYAVPYKMITKKLDKNSTSVDFNQEFTKVAIEQIFHGILLRIANINNVYGDLK